MRKNLAICLLVVFMLIVGFLVIGCDGEDVTSDNGEDVTTDPTTEDPVNITLDFATFWPAVDFQVADGHKRWAEEISTRVANNTPHTVDFIWHDSQSLLSMPEIYQGVADGVADIGSTCPAYTPGVFPATEAFELPGYNNDNALVASMVMHEAWKQSELLQAEYEDVKVMHFWATGPGDFMTNTPIRSSEDLAGVDIRAVGGTIPWVNALGANPVNIGMGAAYENLDSGAVDGLLAPTDVLKGFRLAEVTKYVTLSPPTYNIIFMKVMNWDTWNSLPKSVQDIFDAVNEEFVAEYGKLRADETILGLEYAVNEHGHEVIELEEDEYDYWVSLIDPIMLDWIDKANDAGLPGEDLVEMARELDAKYSEEYGDYGN